MVKRARSNARPKPGTTIVLPEPIAAAVGRATLHAWPEPNDKLDFVRDSAAESLGDSSTWFEASQGGHYRISVAWSQMGDRAEPVAVLIQGPWGEPLTADAIRRLPLGSLVDDCRTSVSGPLERWAAHIGRSGADVDDMERAAEMFRAKRGRELSADELDAVAMVYRLAFERNLPPKRAVAEAFHLSISGAANRIRLARDAGLLGRTRPGKASL